MRHHRLLANLQQKRPPKSLQRNQVKNLLKKPLKNLRRKRKRSTRSHIEFIGLNMVSATTDVIHVSPLDTIIPDLYPRQEAGD